MFTYCYFSDLKVNWRSIDYLQDFFETINRKRKVKNMKPQEAEIFWVPSSRFDIVTVHLISTESKDP